MNTKIRFATADDSNAIRDIYAHYVLETTVSFDYDVPTYEEYREKLLGITAYYPFLVCVAENQDGRDEIVGYAYASRFRPRAAYDWSAELSVYISPDFPGHSAGKALYSAVIALAEAQNIRTLYGVVASTNEVSRHLHEGLGFDNLGTFPKSGFKHGMWLDVTWYQRLLGDFSSAPAPIISIHEVADDVKTAILQEAERIIVS